VLDLTVKDSYYCIRLVIWLVFETVIFSRDSVLWHWPLRSIAVSCSSFTVLPLLRIEWSPLLHTSQQRLPVHFNGPDNLPLIVGDLDPHLTHGSLGPHKFTLQQHLDRFSYFCRAIERNQQTDTHTDRSHYSISSNKLHVAIAVMRPNNMEEGRGSVTSIK